MELHNRLLSDESRQTIFDDRSGLLKGKKGKKISRRSTVSGEISGTGGQKAKKGPPYNLLI
jgi:hypothetical protein